MIQLEPKGKDTLVRETIFGSALFVFGLLVVGFYTYHSSHAHQLDKVVLWVGVGSGCFGVFMTNKKLTKEFFATLAQYLPWTKRQEDED